MSLLEVSANRGPLWPRSVRCSASASDVSEGEVVALMGRNGMGKSTTIRAILGLTPASSGANKASPDRISARWPPYRIARLGIGLVPEGRRCFPEPDGGGKSCRRRPQGALDPGGC